MQTSPTATLRRAQIVEGAIDVLAEHGYGATSFARIARHVGLSSTGMISYHFASKAELDAQVIATILEQAVADVFPVVQAADGPRAQLRQYVLGNLTWIGAHRREVAALVEVVAGTRFEAAGADAFLDPATAPVAAILRSGQERGELAPGFDPEAVALAVRGAIDGVVSRMLREPATDVDALAEALADMFDRATRADA